MRGSFFRARLGLMAVGHLYPGAMGKKERPNFRQRSPDEALLNPG
ncbi:hypothetical protein JOD69_002569 [Methylocaldum sp. RMAD-M]|nr:hypothetical protein [Methylocaldum sp. RMAD-M]